MRDSAAIDRDGVGMWSEDRVAIVSADDAGLMIGQARVEKYDLVVLPSPDMDKLP
tara:strand:- start:859 stop:1023 length:165 start_codon:yes stop_codon:yes gene_type:complete